MRTDPKEAGKTLHPDHKIKSGLKAKRTSVLLRDKAYAALHDRILSGEFESGVFLSERQVAGWLKMSKTPIRAAFGRLEQEGFLAISPQQGVVVRELTIEEIADHFELRSALETFTVRNLAGRVTPAQAAKLEANMLAQEECVRLCDVAQSCRLDGEFHLLLSEFVENTELLRVMWLLRDKIFRVIKRVHAKHPERLATNFPEHRSIVEAIFAGDGELAARRMSNHLERGKQFLLSPRRSPVEPPPAP
jgi:DNA-binding GntR family transcriptional regulator